MDSVCSFWMHETWWKRVMREKVWVRMCYPNDPIIPMATGAGTHARHKGILGKHRFYIALALHSCAITPVTLKLLGPLTFTLRRHTHTVLHKWTVHTHLTHTHTPTQCVTPGRVMTILTSLFLSPFLSLSISKDGPHPSCSLKRGRDRRFLKKRMRREKRVRNVFRGKPCAAVSYLSSGFLGIVIWFCLSIFKQRQAFRNLNKFLSCF